MTLFILGAAIILLLIIVVTFKNALQKAAYDIAKKEILNVRYPYKKIEHLFTPAEHSFLGVLNQVIPPEIHIFGKVRVADIITPDKALSQSKWQTAFNKISRKHFDFLLCNKKDSSVLCVIELNDKSHNHGKRIERDIFLDNVCESAEIPLIKIQAKYKYSINEVKEELSKYLPDIRCKKPSAPEILSEEIKQEESNNDELLVNIEIKTDSQAKEVLYHLKEMPDENLRYAPPGYRK